MSETFFPVSDLLRRKLQTSISIVVLTLSVASVIFLLSLSERINIGIFSATYEKLTASFSMVFWRFTVFTALLIFAVGVVLVSFMVFLMMRHRVNDIGLIRAIGCPNNMVFAYFMNELLIVTLTGCILGAGLGAVADFVSVQYFESVGVQISRGSPNLWTFMLVPVLFLVLALIIGLKPVLDVTKVKPVEAMSPAYSVGLSKDSHFKPTSRRGITLKLMLRSLARRQAATFRIILCLTTVFILLTVTIAGSLIANNTTSSWLERAVGRHVMLIGHRDICNQYEFLLSKFQEPKIDPLLNYTEEKYLLPSNVITSLNLTSGVSAIEERLLLMADIQEVQGYILSETTGGTRPVGDNRHGECLVIGIDPTQTAHNWFMTGEFLTSNQAEEAVLGDTTAQKLFSMPLNQALMIYGKKFDVVGVCIDPVNNGNITYVPLGALKEAIGVQKANLLMVTLDPSFNHTLVLSQIKAVANSINSEFDVVELDAALDENLNLLSGIWSVIFLLPLFCLASASLCVVGYVVLNLKEQRRELGTLRALGVGPRGIVAIVFWQNLAILLSSCAVGIAVGVMLTLLILVPQPAVTVVTIAEIAGWLLAAFVIALFISLYPVFRFVSRPIVEVMD